jgi:hypothetical protein
MGRCGGTPWLLFIEAYRLEEDKIFYSQYPVWGVAVQPVPKRMPWKVALDMAALFRRLAAAFAEKKSSAASNPDSVEGRPRKVRRRARCESNELGCSPCPDETGRPQKRIGCF